MICIRGGCDGLSEIKPSSETQEWPVSCLLTPQPPTSTRSIWFPLINNNFVLCCFLSFQKVKKWLCCLLFTGTEVNQAAQSTREGIRTEMACVAVNVYMYYTVHTDTWDNWVFVNVALVHILFFLIYIYIYKTPAKCLTDAFFAKTLFPEATLLVTARGCTVFWSPLGFIFLTEWVVTTSGCFFHCPCFEARVQQL